MPSRTRRAETFPSVTAIEAEKPLARRRNSSGKPHSQIGVVSGGGGALVQSSRPASAGSHGTVTTARSKPVSRAATRPVTAIPV